MTATVAPGMGLPLYGNEDDWRRNGLCRGSRFPDRWHSYTVEDVAKAKAVCAQCPVLSACREWGLTHAEASGIWGGMTERERSRELKIRKELRP